MENSSASGFTAHKVNDNLLGDARFSPIVRRTETLTAYEKKDLPGRSRQLLEEYPRDILRRALSYLYTKETKEAYDAALEAFSIPLLPLVDYNLDYQGRTTVQNETALRYRFIDMTAQTEALFGFVERVIETDLVQELDFLRNYYDAKSTLQAIVDMPDRLINLFIRLCVQNKGVISASKRKTHFDMLTDEEIAEMEQAIRESHLVE